MAKLLDTSEFRGTAKHGWLYSRHTFIFGNYYNPERMGFGLLRIINDDIQITAQKPSRLLSIEVSMT